MHLPWFTAIAVPLPFPLPLPTSCILITLINQQRRFSSTQGANKESSMGIVMATTSSSSSSPLSRGKVGVSRVSLRLGMAVLLLYIAAHSCAALDLPLPDESNGVKEGPDKFYCFRGFRRCMSGIEQCIKPEQECDGIKDCADGSDEGQRCKSFDCVATRRYTCPSGRMCMNVTRTGVYTPYADYTEYLCDGVKDCADGSDEDPRFCASYDCSTNASHLFLPSPSRNRTRCPGGKGGCVTEAQLCDGVVDCVGDGGSDESDKYCKERGCSLYDLSSLFQCGSGRCIRRDRVCDGTKDCPGGDDEGELCDKMCRRDQFRCTDDSNSTCIPERQFCDGVEDCPGGTDEKQCGTFSCEECPGGKQCTRFTRCNGVKECRDGSDEDPTLCRTYNCSAYEFKCKDGVTCIPHAYVCDGEKHCPDKSDEDPVFCRTRHNCSSVPFYPSYRSFYPSYRYINYGSVKCPGSAYVWCTTVSQLCNGVQGDCYGDEDEKPEFCASEETRNLLAANGRINCGSNMTEFTYGYYCDGMNQCEDGSDEGPEFCRRYKCPEGRVRCYGKWCVTGRLCDGERDCPDGSDEKGCST